LRDLGDPALKKKTSRAFYKSSRTTVTGGLKTRIKTSNALHIVVLLFVSVT